MKVRKTVKTSKAVRRWGLLAVCSVGALLLGAPSGGHTAPSASVPQRHIVAGEGILPPPVLRLVSNLG